MKLEEKLTALRKENGLSQTELAERLDVTRQAISRWETGTSAPSTDNLISLSRLYGVGLDDLLGDKAKEEAKPTDPSTNTSATEEAADKRKRKTHWRIIAIGAVLILGVLLAIVIHTALNKTPDASRVEIGEMDGEKVGTVSTGGFAIEEW